MKRPNHNVPLIVEPHPETYVGYPFITLIRYNDTNTLNIIDNIISKSMHTYVLDLCAPSDINEIDLISIANDWYCSGNYKLYPLSIEFSKLGMSQMTNKILRVFPVDYVTRIIGPVNEYPMSGYSRCRKRKKRPA